MLSNLTEEFVYRIKVLGFKKEFKLIKKVSEVETFFVLDLHTKINELLQKTLKLPEVLFVRLESQVPHELAKAVIQASEFSEDLYRGYSYKEDINGVQKKWSDQGTPSFSDFFVDPLFLFFNLPNFLERKKILLLSGRKIEEVQVHGNDSKGFLQLRSRKLKYEIKNQQVEKLKVDLLPLVSLLVERVRVDSGSP